MSASVPCRPLFRADAAVEHALERWWHEAVRRHHPRLIASVRRVIARRGADLGGDQAEDLAQEVWCRVLVRRDARGFRGTSEGEALVYLRRVIESVVADADRAARAQKRAVALTFSLEDARTLSTRAADGASPEARLLAAERRRLVMARCRGALGRRASPLALRAARLALLDGLSSAEISRRLAGQLTAAAIDTMICRLRRRLAAQGVELPRRARIVR